MKFDVTDHDDGGEAVIDALLERFAPWLDHHRTEHRGAGIDAVGHALDWKAQRADGDLGRWLRAHVDDLLTVDLPRRLSASLDEAAAYPPSLAALFAFLADEGLLDPRGDDADVLARRALSLTEPFLAAMAEPAVHGGPTKRIFDALGFEPGGDLTQADVDDVMDRFNALSFEERGRILGLDDDGPGSLVPPVQSERPSMPLPARPDLAADELDRRAGEVVWVQRVEALLAEVGDGIALTKAGWLPLADGRRIVAAAGLPGPVAQVRSTRDLRGLFGLVQIALTARAATLLDGRLVPLEEWRGLTPGERWLDVVDAVLDIGPATLAFGAVEPMPLQLADVADQAGCAFLAMLWLAGEPLPTSALAEMIADVAAEGEAGTEVLRHADLIPAIAAQRADDTFTALAEAGVVDVVDEMASLRRGPERSIAPWLESVGFVASFLEDLDDLDGDSLLDALVGDLVDPAPEHLSAWFEADPGRAAEVVAAAVARPDPRRLLTAQGLLDAAGDAGRAALSDARDTPLGPLVWVQMVEAGEVSIDEAPPGAAAEAGVLTMLAVLDGGTPADLVEQMLAIPADAQGGLVDHLATASHPRTGELLEVVGRNLPDKAAGKHARKVAHRWRSRHGVAR